MAEKRSYTRALVVVKLLVVMLAVAALLLIAYMMTNIKEADVVEGKHYTEDEIKDYVMDTKLDNNAIYLYFKYKYGNPGKIPFVEYVDVELTGRNSVKITAYEKNVVGCISYMNKYIYFDKDGYFIEQSDEKLEDIPYITGLDFNSITLYDKMSVDGDNLFKVILNLTQMIDKYSLKIDEINFDSSQNVTLYSDDIEVLLGNHKNYDEQMAKLSGLLEKAQGMSGTFHMENYKNSSENIIFNKK